MAPANTIKHFNQNDNRVILLGAMFSGKNCLLTCWMVRLAVCNYKNWYWCGSGRCLARGLALLALFEFLRGVWFGCPFL